MLLNESEICSNLGGPAYFIPYRALHGTSIIESVDDINCIWVGDSGLMNLRGSDVPREMLDLLRRIQKLIADQLKGSDIGSESPDPKLYHCAYRQVTSAQAKKEEEGFTAEIRQRSQRKKICSWLSLSFLCCFLCGESLLGLTQRYAGWYQSFRPGLRPGG